MSDNGRLFINEEPEEESSDSMTAVKKEETVCA